MPQYRLVDEASGRWMDVEAPDVPSEEQAKFLWGQYDALKVASTPKGSEERRRALAQEVAAQSQQAFAEGSGGATASTGTTMGASLGRSLSEAGTKLMGGVARGFEMLKEGLGAPEGGFTTVNPEINPATRSPEQIEQDIAANRLYQQAQELEAQAKAFYPVNPDKPWANLPGQAIGSAAQMLATGPARIPAYALSALESGAQSALEAGATPAQAQAQGLVEGAMGGASEKLLGLAPFLKEVGGKNLREVSRMGAKALLRTAGQEAIQEPTEGILNRLSSKYVTGANPNEAVFDPQTLAMEAAGGAIGAAGIQIPTIGAARLQRSYDVGQRRAMGLAGRSEQQLQAELEAFNRGIQQSQLTGGDGQLVLRTGDPYQAQLDLSAQNAPPQFQMVTSEAPRTARGVSQRLAESGLREEVVADGRTPIDQFIGRARNAELPNAERRRAELAAGLTLPQDTGKLPSDEPQPPIPTRYAQAPQLASLGTTPRTAMTTTPIDEAFMGGRLQRASLPLINPDLQRLQDAAEAELNAIERFPNRDTRRRDALLGAAPQVIQILDSRINNSIGTVSDAEVGRLMDLRERLARFYNDQTAYNQLTAEAIGIARDTRRPAPRMAAGLSQLEQSRQAQFPAGGAAIQPEQPQSILPQGDLMSRLRDARKMDELRQPSPMSAAALGTGQPVGGPPAVADLTPFLQFYENKVQAPAPLLDVRSVPAQPQAEAQAPQGVANRQGQAPGQVRSKNVNLRAKVPKSKKSSQTITGSNVQTGTEMPVQPPAGEAIDAATQAELQELDELMLKRGQAQNKVKGVSFTKKDDTRFRELLEKNRGRILEQVDPGADPVVGTDINGSPILQSASGTYYTFENGRVRTGPSFASAPLSRSEPAAAQGVATEGAATPAGAGVAAFETRKYGNKLFVDQATYNRLRPQIDQKIAEGDETAKRINTFEVNAGDLVKLSNTYFMLTPEGQEKVRVKFGNKLYQSAAKWLSGEEFEFSPMVIAKSLSKDVYNSASERNARATTSGESSEEGGVETRGAFETLSQPVLPQVPLQAPVKVKEEVVLTMANLQRQLNATTAQFANVIQAYANPDREADLDDAEMAMLEQARPMLGRLDSIAYSVSSLIREPIGRSRALQAVDKWKLETGAVGARIEVVEDPNLTTPDGRPIAAMVETRPGELPLITLNAAHIASEQEVREKLWHEALHPVWNEPSVQKAWGDVVNALPRGAVQSELARGYDPLEATMEAAINAASVQANNTPVRSAWQKFLDAVWEALGRAFGFDTKPKDFEQLMEGALRSLSRPYNQAPSTQYAEQLTQQDAEYLAAVQRGDMATAQRMVDEAAKAAGYGAKLFHGTNATNYVPGKSAAVNQNAKNNLQALASRVGLKEWNGVTSVYRRLAESGLMGVTQGDVENAIRWQSELGGSSVSGPRDELAFQVFNLPSGELELGVHLGPESAAKQFGTVFPFYVNFKNPIRTSDLGTWNYQSVIREIRKAGVKISESEYDRVFNSADSNAELRKILLSKGIDSVVYENEVEGERGQDSFIALSPSQIKSADPVTYDDAGNPIPLSRRFQPDSPDIRYSVANSFAMAKNPTEIQKRLETSSDPESLLAMGRAVASLITPEFEATLQSLENAAPGSPEATTRSFLKRADQLAKTGEAVVEWAQTHQTPIPAFQSLDDLDPQWRAVVGNAMMGAHFELGQQMKSIDKAIENASQQLTEASADLMEADEKRLVAESTKSEATRLLNGLLRTIALERNKLGTSSQTLSKQEADDAAKFISQIKKNKLAVLSKGLETMAREMPIAGFASNSEALAWLKNRQQTAPIFGQDAQDALTALEKALQRQPDLTKRIEQIRALTLDNVDALREVNQLTQLIGKNKASTIKNYAKLRADYESAFRRLKNASSRVETWSNKMDGLLKAKEALGGLMGSPDYTGKLEKVFGDSRAVLSGLMAPMMEGGQANGVVEFYGPSAYKAAGGIVRGKELANLREGKNQVIADFGSPNYGKAPGTIYRIDWKPGFDVEKKNLENLNGLMLEIADALGNPESPNYITDPQARTSYEVVKNHVGQFLLDRRYLVEQQSADSAILSILKPFNVVNGVTGLLSTIMPNSYTTRMNAATALGGRGGRAFEESNTALDTFEKKAENSLRDTQTENAVARRAAIQSHGMNPDNPEDVAKWSAHNSSVLGSMQNPSQDQLKEGDYVGEMRVTKEDLRSARIQKQFSSRVVEDFSSMKSDFFEVVNPEEEIGGILFTRAAEDYGMKTARKFSEWGSKFADRWKTATEADQVAFRQKQADANGQDEVEMVWDNRENLANEFISGPVYSHITETNSEYTGKRAAFLNDAFKKLRKDIKAGRTDGLETIEAISATISLNSVGEDGVAKISPNEARIALLAAVGEDVKSYMDADSEFSESGLGKSVLPDAVLSVKAANGALAKARGKMVAPTWFYDYGMHNDIDRAMHIASGKRILLMKVYETMTAYRNAIKRNLDEAERQIELDAQKMGRNGQKVGLAKAERDYDKAMAKKYEGKEVVATRKMLKKSYEALSTLTQDVKNHLAVSSGVDSDQFMARAGRSFLGTLATTGLSNVTSIVNNMTATVLDPYRTWSMSNRFWLKVWGPTKAVGRAIKFFISDVIAMLPSRIRNSLTKERRNSLVEVVAAPIRAAIQERMMFEKAGQMPTFDSITEIYKRLKANPLTFGRTTKSEERSVERFAGWLMGKAPWAVAFGSWVKERIPGYFDGVINRVIAADARDFEQWLSPHLWEWARNLPGKTVAEKMEAVRDSVITAEDLGVTEEGLAQIRDFMSSAGSLEVIAQRMLSLNVDKDGNESFVTDLPLSQPEREGVQFYAGRKYNVRASSTKPDFVKATSGTKGVLMSGLHMFTSWVLQRMGADANQFFKVKGGGLKKELAVAWNALMLVLVTIITGALGKTLKDGWRYLTGNPATTPNIFQAIESPEMAMRYLAASTAGVLYFGGQIAGELMGGTGISSPLNNNLLDNNMAAGFIASAISTAQRAYQTGDLKYPLVDFTRKNFWPAGVVLNYAMPGDVEARGASRAVRMGAAGMEVRPVGGGVGARETPTTPLVRDAVAALYEGDSAGYQKAREKFIAYQIGQGKTQKEAERRFDSSVSGRDPLRSVLGRTPTEDEEATILRRLTPGQRATVSKARSLFRKPKKIGLGRAKTGRRVRLGRKRPARRRVRLRRAGA